MDSSGAVLLGRRPRTSFSITRCLLEVHRSKWLRGGELWVAPSLHFSLTRASSRRSGSTVESRVVGPCLAGSDRPFHHTGAHVFLRPFTHTAGPPSPVAVHRSRAG